MAIADADPIIVTVGAPNTSGDSWWGSDCYAEFFSFVTAVTVPTEVEIPRPTWADGSQAYNAIEIDIFLTSDVPSLGGPFVPGQNVSLAWITGTGASHQLPGGKFTVQPGTEYTVVVTSFAATNDAGRQISIGDTAWRLQEGIEDAPVVTPVHSELGGYVRHRDRMVQESVYQDLKDTLIACRWMAGTTSKPVIDPYDPASGPVNVTTPPGEVLKLTQGDQVNLIDYFPQAEDGGQVKAEPNTFALDNGTADDLIPMEMGSNAAEQVYNFTMAFWSKSDALGLAVMNDLRDRYNGRIVRNETISLWDYNNPQTNPVVRMDIDRFQYTQNVDNLAVAAEVHLFFAQLTITDYVDSANG